MNSIKNEVPAVFSVSQITGLIKETLEGGFGNLSVEGEISNYRPASSGHVYFSLKDADAMISCVLFRGNAAKLTFLPGDGKLVRIRGDLSVYPKRGNYQIIVSSMSLAGEGAILQMLEERKRRFAAEGLFDQNRKKPLPLNPERIGVVTSPTGAAVRDILQVLKRRHSGISVIILPAAVQGEDAPEQIARQIKTANLHMLCDVLIIGRGGGSLEDLLPFSDEKVVRAVAESDIPLISSVGHEIDWALSDFAADLRAPTPSAAAELVSASRDELGSRIETSVRYLSAGLQSRISGIRNLLERFSPRTMERTLRQKLQPLLLRLDDGKEDLSVSLEKRILAYRHRLALAKERLVTGSPLQIMSKGYSLVKSGDKIISEANQINPDSLLDIKLYRGNITARVESTREENNSAEI